jgi:hypothetical protein
MLLWLVKVNYPNPLPIDSLAFAFAKRSVGGASRREGKPLFRGELLLVATAIWRSGWDELLWHSGYGRNRD